MTGGARPWRAEADGLRLQVRLMPGAGRAGPGAVVEDAAGASWLKIGVTEAPEKGRANDALIALLAKALRLPKSAIALVRGDTDRTKLLHLAGDPAELARRLEGWISHG